MQTLTPGAFLNLGSSEKTDSLRFTAAQLAENSSRMIPQKVTLDAIENLADRLWEKAEYVAKDAEKPQLKQIFVRHFVEKFCELKPDTAAVEETANETSANQSERWIFDDPVTVNNCAADEIQNTTEGENPPEQNHGDEFLGLVKDDNSPLVKAQAVLSRENEVASQTVFSSPNNEAEQLETPSDENRTAEANGISQYEQKEATKIAETTMEIAQTAALGVNGLLTSVAAPPTVKAEDDKAASILPQPEKTKSVGVTAEDKGSSLGAVANVKTDESEPFEFDKCAINVSFQLLPLAEIGADEAKRTMLVSIVSHGNPPEVEMVRLPAGAMKAKLQMLCPAF